MGEAASSFNPCVSCGACCGFFRVHFHWRETVDKGSENVPEELTVDIDPTRKCMKGTTEKYRIRCAALTGSFGKKVGCSIYGNRPTPCRDFGASYENGVRNPRCDEARKAHDLPPLRKEDWAT